VIDQLLDPLLNVALLAEAAPALEIPAESAAEIVKTTSTEVVKIATHVANYSPRINFGYLVAAVLFILGIKGMTHPRTAVRGNLFGALGMLIAVVVTLLAGGVNYWLVFAGMLVGSAGGVWLANTVQMTQMPQLVALFNGFGGIASVLVAAAEVLKGTHGIGSFAAGLTGLIGSVTFTG